MKETFEPDFFRCYICEKYYPTDSMKTLRLKDVILPKDVCLGCEEKMKNGLSKREILGCLKEKEILEEKNEKK